MLKRKPIERVSGFTHSLFEDQIRRAEPVVFTDLLKDNIAFTKWNFSFFKSQYGHLKVPLYCDNGSLPGKTYLSPEIIVTFKEYFTMIEEGRTDYRMFLFNIFKKAPELVQDINNPSFASGFKDRFPFMFFGGKGSKVALHFDIDLAHVFLNQFEGRKRVQLIAPKYSKALYHHPFTVASYVDLDNPNYAKFPAIRHVEIFECILHPGESLLIPSGFWHRIEYLDASFSLSQRAQKFDLQKMRGFLNIATHFVIDRGMNKIWGPRWRNWKSNMANRRAQQLI